MGEKGTRIVELEGATTECGRAEKALRESEERFRTLAESAQDCIFIIDSDMRVQYVNRFAVKLFRKSQGKIIGKLLEDLFPSETYAHQRFHIQKVFKTGLPGSHAARTRFPDRELWLDTRLVPLRSERGDISAIMSVSRDFSERRRAQKKVKQQVEQLAALNEIDKAISGSLDLSVILQIILNQLTDKLEVNAASVLLLNESNRLEYVSGCGFRTSLIKESAPLLGQGNAGRAALERHLVSIPDFSAGDAEISPPQFVKDEGFAAYFGVPLVVKGKVKGVLEIFHRRPLNVDENWLTFLKALAGQAGIAIDHVELFQKLERSNTELSLAYDATIEILAGALKLRDRPTEDHARRVAKVTVQLAHAMGISEQEMVHVRRGALLHDIGKIAIPDSILLKKGPLTDQEWEIMREHPSHAYKWLYRVPFLRPALNIPYSHHERWDGTGYPRGLKGEEIPLEARVFAVVDVWDALGANRPYATPWPQERIREHIQASAGTHFDPKVVEVFLEIVQ